MPVRPEVAAAVSRQHLVAGFDELDLLRRPNGHGDGCAGDEALRVLGARRHPGDVPEHERVVAAIREGLGDSRFEELRSEGALLTLDQVLSRILDGDVRIPGPVQKPVQIGVEKP